MRNRAKAAGQQLDANFFGPAPETSRLISKTPAAVPLGATAKWWFRKHFIEKGYSFQDAERYSDIAMRVGTMMPELDRIALAEFKSGPELDNLFGVYSKADKLIGVRDMEMIRGNAPWNAFYQLVVLGHEATHGLVDAYRSNTISPERAELVSKALNHVTNMNGLERQLVMKDLYDVVVPKEIRNDPKVREFIEQTVVLTSEAPEEFLAHYGALAMLGLASPAKFKGNVAALRDYIRFSPQHLAEFLTHNFLDVANMTETIGDYLSLHTHYPKGYTQTVVKNMKQLTNTFRKLASTQQEIDLATKRMTRLLNNIDGGMPSLLGEMYVFTKDGLDFNQQIQRAYKDSGIAPNWVENVMLPAAVFAARYPIAKPIIDVAYNFRAYANRLETALFRPFMMQDKKGHWRIDTERSGLAKVMGDEKIRDAFNAICLEQNQRMKEGQFTQPMTVKEIGELCTSMGLKGSEVELVNNTFTQTMESMKIAREIRIRSQLMNIGVVAAHSFLGIAGHNADSARKLGSLLVENMWERSEAMVSNRPQDLMKAEQAIADVQRMVPDQAAFAKAYQDSTELLLKLTQQKKLEESQLYYTPEVRIGKWFVRYKTTDNEKPYLAGFKTQAEARKVANAAAQNPKLVPDSLKLWDKADELNDANLLTTKMASAFTSLEKEAYEKQVAALLAKDPTAQDVIQKLAYNPGAEVVKEMVARGTGKYSMHRALTPGRETINFMEGIVHYLSGVANGSAKVYSKNLAMLYLADESLRNNPKIRSHMRDYISQVIDPPGKEWSKIKGMVFLFTIGLNPSSILVERLQPLFTLAPYLTEQGAGLAGAYKLMGKAYKQVWNLKMENGRVAGLSPELNAALERATQDRIIDFGIYQELAHDTDVQIANLRNIGPGNPVVDKLTMATKPVYWLTNLARTWYTNQTTVGNKVAFLASYELAKSKGMNPEQAYSFAATATRTSMFGGGQAARPIGMFNNAGKFYGAVGAMYTLQHYTASTIGTMYRMAMDGFTKMRREGMTEKQVRDTRKAFTQMFVMQFAAAGAMGLPGVGFALSALEQLFPDLQAKANLREGLASLGGDDQELGEVISDSLLNGFMTKSLGLGAIDMSSRFSLGNFLGMDSQKGLDLANLGGPTVGVLSNFAKAVQKMSQGDFAEGAALAAPTAFKNAIRLWHNDGVVRDPEGRMVYSPSEFEKMASLVGLRPKRMSDVMEAQRLSRRASDIAAHKLRDFHEELAILLLNGQAQQVQQALLARARQDPLYSPQQGLSAVARIAQERTTPKNPLATGSVASLADRQLLAATYGSIPHVSEVQKYMLRKKLEASVGLPGAGIPNRHELNQLRLAERIAQMHPGLQPAYVRALLAQRQGRARVGIPLDAGFLEGLGPTSQSTSTAPGEP